MAVKMKIISELHKGAKLLQYNFDFMNKIEERANTVFLRPNCVSDSSWGPDELFFTLLILKTSIIYTTI